MILNFSKAHPKTPCTNDENNSSYTNMLPLPGHGTRTGGAVCLYITHALYKPAPRLGRYMLPHPGQMGLMGNPCPFNKDIAPTGAWNPHQRCGMVVQNHMAYERLRPGWGAMYCPIRGRWV